jgi:hypothetical protein
MMLTVIQDPDPHPPRTAKDIIKTHRQLLDLDRTSPADSTKWTSADQKTEQHRLIRRAGKAIANFIRKVSENPDSGNFEGGVIVIDSSELQQSKQDSSITLTEAGRSIDVNPLPEKAHLSIREHFESDSKEIDFKNSHP